MSSCDADEACGRSGYYFGAKCDSKRLFKDLQWICVMEEIGNHNRILDKFKWDKAKEAEKAVISEKKESRSSYSFLDIRRAFLSSMRWPLLFTVHEMHMGDIELEPSSSLIVTTKSGGKSEQLVFLQTLRYYSFTSVPWQYSIPEMPCAALFRIGGADPRFHMQNTSTSLFCYLLWERRNKIGSQRQRVDKN